MYVCFQTLLFSGALLNAREKHANIASEMRCSNVDMYQCFIGEKVIFTHFDKCFFGDTTNNSSCTTEMAGLYFMQAERS